MTPNDVYKYFKQAGMIDSRVALNDLTVSSCRASGRLRIGDGTVLRWNIGLFRDGYLRAVFDQMESNANQNIFPDSQALRNLRVSRNDSPSGGEDGK
ncbi:MAG: hypothetical protein FWD68_07970, partial [Alphaproteobacteria bacterium]|nr:hypothetical protein [Alphaproteobacteria bacterium]